MTTMFVEEDLVVQPDDDFKEIHAPGEAVENRPSNRAIPSFEGQEVEFTKAKFVSASNLEIDDAVFHTDEITRFIVEARVTGVSHTVNQNTGKMERVHTLKVIDTMQYWGDETIDQMRDRP